MLFLVIFVSGFWLSRSGKPYNVVIFTVHKLVSLGAVVFLAATIHQVAGLGVAELLAGVVTGLLFLCTFISGGFLSTGKPMPAAVLKMHRVTPFLTVLSTTVTLYIL